MLVVTVLCLTSTQGIGTQVLGRSSKHGALAYSGKCTTMKSGRGQSSRPLGKDPGVDFGNPTPASIMPSVRCALDRAYKIATTTRELINEFNYMRRHKISAHNREGRAVCCVQRAILRALCMCHAAWWSHFSASSYRPRSFALRMIE